MGWEADRPSPKPSSSPDSHVTSVFPSAKWERKEERPDGKTAGETGHSEGLGSLEPVSRCDWAGPCQVSVALTPTPTPSLPTDPFVKVYLLQDGRKMSKKKTAVKRDDPNPVFNEAMIFSVPAIVLQVRAAGTRGGAPPSPPASTGLLREGIVCLKPAPFQSGSMY